MKAKELATLLAAMPGNPEVVFEIREDDRHWGDCRIDQVNYANGFVTLVSVDDTLPLTIDELLVKMFGENWRENIKNPRRLSDDK